MEFCSTVLGTSSPNANAYAKNLAYKHHKVSTTLQEQIF